MKNARAKVVRMVRFPSLFPFPWHLEFFQTVSHYKFIYADKRGRSGEQGFHRRVLQVRKGKFLLRASRNGPEKWRGKGIGGR